MFKRKKQQIDVMYEVNRPKSLFERMYKSRQLYIFLLPALLSLLIFSYWPMYGILLAFKEYMPLKGIIGSPWASNFGMEHFQRFFSNPKALKLIWNTIVISLYSLIAGFPIPIILALGLNSLRSVKLKKFVQTVTYAPHFISIVVLVGMINIFLSPNSGLINKIVELFGHEPILFMGYEKYWRHIYIWSGIWQSMGWSAIIYIASLAGVSPELHEAAIVDGATKMQRIKHIDIPTIMPTMVIILILNCGSIMGVGFEKAYLMQNPLNLGVSEIISTYIYKVGLIDAQYGLSTAVGIFNSVVNAILLISVNKIAKRVSSNSLW